MRIALAGLLATGCLASPPGAAGDPDREDGGHGAGDPGDGVDAAACVSGSPLDLVYIDRLEVGDDVYTEATTAGLALVVNPGTEPILLGDLSVAPPRVVIGGLSAEFSFEGAGAVAVGPGAAHGSLGPAAVDPIMALVTEAWENTAAPALSGSLSGIPEDGVASIEVRVGDYLFDIAIEIAVAADDTPITPMSATRVTALCP